MDLQTFIAQRLDELRAQGITARMACEEATKAGYKINRQRLSQIKISGIHKIEPETLRAVARALRADVEDVTAYACNSLGLPLRVRRSSLATLRIQYSVCETQSSEIGEVTVSIEDGDISDDALLELVRRIEAKALQEHQRLGRSAHDDGTRTAG